MTEKKRGYCEGYTFVRGVDKVPNKPHYAVVKTKNISYLDPYSDTNPHGDRYVTDSSIEYIAFDDEGALNDYIFGMGRHETYKVIHVSPVEVKLHTTVEIKT